MKKATLLTALSIILCVSMVRAENNVTQTPYIEAINISNNTSPNAADLQRELVLLNVQTRLTPAWPAAYRQLADSALKIGRTDLAMQALQKYLTLTKINAQAQLELINLKLQSYQTTEARRQFFNARLKGRDLLPEIISDIYRQLGQIAWQGYENDRAKKYLDKAIKRMPQNHLAWQLMTEIMTADKTAGPLEEMETRVGELQSRTMINPLDAQAAFELAVLAGKANMPQMMIDWLEQAKEIRSEFLQNEPWPIADQLSLAESYLAVNQPQKAITFLTKAIRYPKMSPADIAVESASTTTPVTTQPSTQISYYTDIHARILIALCAKSMEYKLLLIEQEKWFDKFTLATLSGKVNSANEMMLVSLWYSLYAPEPKPLQAVELSRKALKLNPDNVMTKITLALALAKDGDIEKSQALLSEIDDDANPLVALTKITIELNQNDPDKAKAKSLLKTALENTPFGPIRSVMANMAETLKVENIQTEKLEKVHDQFNGFDQNYIVTPSKCAEMVALEISSDNKVTRGQLGDLTITLRNKSKMTLRIGAGLINSHLAVEIQPTSNTKQTMIHYTKIDSREILEPGGSVSTTMKLSEVNGWDSFIANRNDKIKAVRIQASVIAEVPISKPQMVTLRKSPTIDVDLPSITPETADIMTKYLQKNITKQPWQTARLAYWLLLANDLREQHAKIIDGMINQLKKTNPPETRAAFAWALRASKASKEVFNTIASRLNDKDWFVRLMCLDTLGQMQGENAKQLFEYYATKDDDSSVRQLSTSYLMSN